MSQVEEILQARGAKYGEFKNHAEITQYLMDICEDLHKNIHGKSIKSRLTYSQREALHMIFHKIGRIINGDPNYADSWVDIAGYAQLVANELDSREDK